MKSIRNTAEFWFFFRFTAARGKVHLRCSEG